MSDLIDISPTVGWVMSGHAKAAAHKRGITTRAVLECLAAPEITYPSRDQHIVRRGRLAVVADTASQVVLTVLLTGSESWNDIEARAVFAAV